MQGTLEAPAERSSWLGSPRGRTKRIIVYATILFYLFVVMLVSTVLLVGALTFVPALALGPVVEQLQMIAP